MVAIFIRTLVNHVLDGENTSVLIILATIVLLYFLKPFFQLVRMKWQTFCFLPFFLTLCEKLENELGKNQHGSTRI